MSTEPVSPAAASEWTIGWRIVAACAIANGTGVALVFFTFSMFLLPMSAELQLTRSETGLIQSLVVTAALGAPLIGRATDLLGFRAVYTFCTVMIGLTGVVQGTVIRDGWWLGLSVALTAFFGSGASSITLTRPINAHFRKYRGRALGLVGAGVSVTTILVPPVLHWVIESFGWRAGFLGLAGFSLGVGLPLVWALMPREAAIARLDRQGAGLRTNWTFLRQRDFWLLTGSNALLAIAVSGAISQLSPMVQEEGLSAAVAAYAVSLFAAGQFVGKIGGGWLLDRFEPRRVAALLILVPASGFAILLGEMNSATLTLVAATLIGLLHGADIDIYAFFTARRFGYAHYGTVFGVLHGLGWLGIVGGIMAFGASFDRLGSYAPAQILSLAVLVVGALMLLALQLPEQPEPERS